jgi:hypothetical protein
MARVRFDFGTLTLDAELLDTPTARAVAAALPISSSALTWGEEVYFEVPVKVATEKGARAVVIPGEIAYWPEGHCIALGFGRTPISRGDETRLASPCNIFAKALGDVRTLGEVRGGEGPRSRSRASASAADLKFLLLWPRVCLGTSNPKAALDHKVASVLRFRSSRQNVPHGCANFGIGTLASGCGRSLLLPPDLMRKDPGPAVSEYGKAFAGRNRPSS